MTTDRDYCSCEEPGHIKADGICMDCGGKVGRAAAPIDDGGPAFPVDRFCSDPHAGYSDLKAGMTLRDYFAATALNALLLRSTTEDWPIANAARKAYVVADAMLAIRGKQS